MGPCWAYMRICPTQGTPTEGWGDGGMYPCWDSLGVAGPIPLPSCTAAVPSPCGSVKTALIYGGVTAKRMKRSAAASTTKELYCDAFEGATGANAASSRCWATAPRLWRELHMEKGEVGSIEGPRHLYKCHWYSMYAVLQQPNLSGYSSNLFFFLCAIWSAFRSSSHNLRFGK